VRSSQAAVPTAWHHDDARSVKLSSRYLSRMDSRPAIEITGVHHAPQTHSPLTPPFWPRRRRRSRRSRSRPTPPKTNSSACGCTARAPTPAVPTGAISPPSEPSSASRSASPISATCSATPRRSRARGVVPRRSERKVGQLSGGVLRSEDR
jgi:hypothetical protein